MEPDSATATKASIWWMFRREVIGGMIKIEDCEKR
jgi:hypothetical protein